MPSFPKSLKYLNW